MPTDSALTRFNSGVRYFFNHRYPDQFLRISSTTITPVIYERTYDDLDRKIRIIFPMQRLDSKRLSYLDDRMIYCGITTLQPKMYNEFIFELSAVRSIDMRWDEHLVPRIAVLKRLLEKETSLCPICKKRQQLHFQISPDRSYIASVTKHCTLCNSYSSNDYLRRLAGRCTFRNVELLSK